MRKAAGACACWAVLLSLSCTGVRSAAPPSARGHAPLSSFQARLDLARRQLPGIVEAAEAAAERAAAHPDSLINVPYAPQQSFAEEIVNRSGGLANALPSADRPKDVTAHDVLLFSVRSWQEDGERAAQVLGRAAARGWLVILFGPRTGKPPGLKVDYLIDNGGNGGLHDAPVCAVTNVLNAWLWCCEYASALTRRGRSPGILKSGLLPDAAAHNGSYKTREGRRQLDECSTAMARGASAEVYLREVEALVAALGGEPVRGQVEAAADVIARRLARGRKVAIATATHFLMREIFQDNRSPWEAFNVVWHAKTAFAEHVGKGDLLVWFSFRGLSSPYEDYGKYIRQSGADLITCCVPDPDPSNNAGEALCHIDQSWAEGDAVVPIPFPPGRMAPVSGINQGLLYRMLDTAVARRPCRH